MRLDSKTITVKTTLTVCKFLNIFVLPSSLALLVAGTSLAQIKGKMMVISAI